MGNYYKQSQTHAFEISCSREIGYCFEVLKEDQTVLCIYEIQVLKEAEFSKNFLSDSNSGLLVIIRRQ